MHSIVHVEFSGAGPDHTGGFCGINIIYYLSPAAGGAEATGKGERSES